MPLLNKIIDNTLTLKNYKLAKGSCKALAAFFEINTYGIAKLTLQ